MLASKIIFSLLRSQFNIGYDVVSWDRRNYIENLRYIVTSLLHAIMRSVNPNPITATHRHPARQHPYCQDNLVAFLHDLDPEQVTFPRPKVLLASSDAQDCNDEDKMVMCLQTLHGNELKYANEMKWGGAGNWSVSWMITGKWRTQRIPILFTPQTSRPEFGTWIISCRNNMKQATLSTINTEYGLHQWYEIDLTQVSTVALV